MQCNTKAHPRALLGVDQTMAVAGPGAILTAVDPLVGTMGAAAAGIERPTGRRARFRLEKFKILRAGRCSRVILEPIPLVIRTAVDDINKLISPTLDPAALNMTSRGGVNNPTSAICSGE